MTDNINQEISKVIGDRVKSPFLASLTIAWAALNWKFFALVLLGDIPIQTRIDLAEKTLNISTLYTALTVAAFYAFAWPWINHLIETYQSSIKLLGKRETANEDHELDLLRSKQDLEKIRYKTREQHAISKLLATQGQFNKLVSQQKDFLERADALLAEAEERANKMQGFRVMLEMFQQDYQRYFELRGDSQKSESNSKGNE